MSTTEIIAAVLGVLCVGLLIVRNHWSWPIGFVQVVLTGIVLWNAKLYAETGLQVVFAVLQLYGWWAWFVSLRGGDQTDNQVKSEIEIVRLTAIQRAIALVATGVMTCCLYLLLVSFTDGQAPAADSFIAAASLVAQALLAWRYFENWHFWIVIDLVSIPLYASRELYALALLYVVFLGLAIAGWSIWRRQLQQQRVVQGVAT